MSLKKTLPPPQIPSNISAKSKWLAGEGAGSWFSIQEAGIFYKICRFSPAGDLECSNIFQKVNPEVFNVDMDFEFTYLSHCQSVKIIQDTILFKFERL